MNKLIKNNKHSLLHSSIQKIHQDTKFHYGLEGMKYSIQVYEVEKNGQGDKEGHPTEYQYEFEKAMLKHIHDLKNEIREKGWWERGSPKVSQTSFLRSKTEMQH